MIFGIFWGIRIFGIKREKFAFLNLTINANILKQANNLLLISIIIHLENRGQTRISARVLKDLKNKREYKGFLYFDDWDKCKHAGTLKIRPVPDMNCATIIDWYSLRRMKDITIVGDNKEIKNCDLEQLNYLDEYQDPKTNYRDVDFWIEPNETYDLQIIIWLNPGIYALKAYFLGKKIKYKEEEYWSSTKIFNFVLK